MGGTATRLEEVSSPTGGEFDAIAPASTFDPDPGFGRPGRRAPASRPRRLRPPRTLSSCASACTRPSTRSTRTARPSSSGYEVFGLTYDFLVGYGPNNEPAPGFADILGASRRWQVVHVPHPQGHDLVGRHARDRRGCLLLVPDQPRCDHGRRQRRPRLHRSVRRVRRRHQGRVPGRPDDDHDHERPVAASAPAGRPDPAQAHLGHQDLQGDRRGRRFDAPQVGSGPYQLVEWKTGEYVQARAQQGLLGQPGRRGPDHHPVLRQCGHARPGPQGRRDRLRPRRQRPAVRRSSRPSPTS